ncbi:hypothetical protein [Streptomyces sp. Tue6028]|uniref:hypothetical protein n=1 Tax=Streptomyces sp. Tue6028 TaxID=2036037 RepID=UPI003D71CDF2
MAVKKISLFLAVSSALMAGCSDPAAHEQPDGRAPSQSEPPVRSVPAVRTGQLQVSRPLDHYAPDDTTDTQLKRAEAVVVNRCLRDLGYSRHPLDEHATTEAEPNIYEFYWFPRAARTGYSAPAPAPEEASWDAAASRTEKDLLAGQVAVHQGHKVPKDGCYGEAGRRLTKDSRPPRKFSEQGITITRVADASPRGVIESYVSVIRQTLAVQIQHDSRIERVVAQWSSCMRAKGYRYSTPVQAATDKRWQKGSSEGRNRAETATATADMACKKRVGYLDKVVAVESAYEVRYIDQHGEQMEEFLRLRDTWKHNAEQVLR